MNETNIKAPHSISSVERRGIRIEGVCDVISFDEKSVVMETSCGSMAIEGEDLHITVLNITDGKVEIDGRINGVYYFEERPTQKRRLFSRSSD